MMDDQELNESVARKLGWYEEMLPSYVSPWTGKECGNCLTLRNPKTGNSDTIPSYSTDIKAAWEIVEKLKAEGTEFNLGWMEAISYEFTIHKNFEDYEGEADTAPRAICEAFLKLP